MDCCEVDVGKSRCPSCGAVGRTVGNVTLTALIPDKQLEGEWSFCRTQDCPVAYHNEGAMVAVNEVSVPITHKSTADGRPVCYCFGYSANDIERDTSGAIPSDIKARCLRGEDRCPQTNPQGSCCLGNVLEIAREAGVVVPNGPAARRG